MSVTVENMKEQMINAAIEQMKIGGYENLNFANIAKELGASRTNLHHHFKNKEGLGLAATEAYISIEKESVDKIFIENDGDIKSILNEIENHLVVFVNESKNESSCIMARLIQDSGAPNSLRQIAIERVNAEINMIEKQLKKAQKTNQISNSHNCHKLASRIMIIMLGTMQFGLIQEDKKKFSKTIKGALTSLID